jgi:hypothetical protein
VEFGCVNSLIFYMMIALGGAHAANRAAADQFAVNVLPIVRAERARQNNAV